MNVPYQWLKGLIIISVLLSRFCICQAQNKPVLNPPPVDSLRSPAIPQQIVDSHSDVFSSYEFILSCCILSFGLLTLLMITILTLKRVINPSHVLKIIILTLVIICSLLLVTAGYSNSQIAGVTGILGSIAGYLLGRSSETKHDD
jgi:hypothetical protein